MSYTTGQKYLLSQDPMQGSFTYHSEVLAKAIIVPACCNLQQNSEASEEEMQYGE